MSFHVNISYIVKTLAFEDRDIDEIISGECVGDNIVDL